jgi:hypothetical protein
MDIDRTKVLRKLLRKALGQRMLRFNTIVGRNGGSSGDGVDGDGIKLGRVSRGDDKTGVSFVVDGEVFAGEAAAVCFVGQLCKTS